MRKIGLLFSVIAFFAIFGCEKEEKSTIASEIVGTYDNAIGDSSSVKADVTEISADIVNIRIYTIDNPLNDVYLNNLKVTKFLKDSTGGDWRHYTLENSQILDGDGGLISYYEEQNKLRLKLSWHKDSIYYYYSGSKY
jgi:hypothetical protein